MSKKTKFYRKLASKIADKAADKAAKQARLEDRFYNGALKAVTRSAKRAAKTHYRRLPMNVEYRRPGPYLGGQKPIEPKDSAK